jgi:hypothetical protein
MAIMPVPANTKAYMKKWFCTLAGKTTATVDVKLWYRPFGGVFQLKEDIALVGAGSSSFQYDYHCPLEFEGKGDFRITADSGSINAIVSAGFDLNILDD